MKNDYKKSKDTAPSMRFLFSHPCHLISLGFGSGLAPVSPGTMGTLFAWFIYSMFTSVWPEIFTPFIWGIIIILGFIGGIWICGFTGQALNSPDHSGMVWDEIVSFWLVLLFVMPASFLVQLLAFLLFRFFDIVKPPPIKYIDQHLKGGLGVMFDDLVAALFTLGIFALWRVLFSS